MAAFHQGSCREGASVNSNYRHKNRLGCSILFLGTLLAGIGLFGQPAGAEGGEPGPHGRLIVEKRVDGNGPVQFSFHVTCTTASGTELDRDFDLVMDGPTASREFDAIRSGAECKVTETDTGKADATVVTPRDGTVVVGDDDPVKVSFVNIFNPPAPTTTTTTTAPPTTTTTVPVVLGATVTRPAPAPTLPVTGRSEQALVVAGCALVALGVALRRGAAKAAR